MNRQEAINIVKKNWPDSSFTSLKEALEFLIPELMNTDDEKIKEAIIKGIIHAAEEGCFCADNYSVKDCIAWLEKQGEHANFRNKIQIGDKVTRNQDGMLVNLSQLNRVAKDEKQGEQKPANKVEPKFKVGDIIKNKKSGDTVKVEQILSDSYCYSGWDGAATIHSDFLISDQDNWELVEQKPADTEKGAKGNEREIPNSAWSEEDESRFNTLIFLVENSDENKEAKEGFIKFINKLKSFKKNYNYGRN